MSDRARRCVLVTGGTGQVGAVLVNTFASSSYEVWFTCRDPDRGQRLSAAAEASGSGTGSVQSVVTDLLEPQSVESLIDRMARNGAMPHCIVNNARDLSNLKSHDANRPARESWLREFELGVVVPHELAVQAARHDESRLESVINIGSMYGMSAPRPELYNSPEDMAPPHYGTVKGALLQLTRELAVRLSPQGIRVNTVSFGGVAGRADSEFEKRYGKQSPQGRMLQDSELGEPVRFLDSPGASSITGHNLVVDGGWTIW